MFKLLIAFEMFKIRVLQNQFARCLITRSYNSFSSSSKPLFQISALSNQKKRASTQPKPVSKPSQPITLIPGDGIGPEMMQLVQTVIK